jgi:hypothetical protein
MPPEIRAALLLWLTALVVLEAGFGLAAGRDVVRLMVLAVATALVMRMAAGHNWARHTLTVVFGLGVPWLAIGAAWWLSGDAAACPTVSRLIGAEPGGLTSVLVAASVLAHVAAVAAGLVYMYRPAANRYFRDARRPAPVAPGALTPAARTPVTLTPAARTPVARVGVVEAH